MPSRTTILLADDEADLREVFTLFLPSAGYTVSAVAQPQAALELLARHPVDLLLIDYQMSEMSGTALIDAARVRHPGVRTVLTSGHLDVATLATACRAHAWYRKGASLDELVATVATTLQVQAPH